ncbi:MAG TPA: glycerol-3-phosphate acyltransferase [Bacteroidales bacterium]|nr:glycerol-3-phosphate acyltransferase [Bacteroidales bacterium]HPF02065.1 glycerol-3-phosphate acyltransferase [Bacteroidales bacterium]HPJ60029.1 glycerol-3-phosphate acyltransferase [Bacteroidales bacterium]HPR11448.1 glycerol-3-phosphate acyltransferase [Bacteroidales bacterium]HRW86127.1 glycerol-3-phosphate acyltransferase [Bacteroidales bacterium]
MNDVIVWFQENPVILSIVCCVAGYLIGSLSFARIIYHIVTRGRKIEPFAEPVPHSDEVFESDLVSATVVSKKLGARFGCLTSVCDMLKVVLPALAVKIIFPGQPYYLLLALFGVIGHIYPIYYKFTGGRGESSIIGILLLINWFGLLIVNAASLLLGFITGSVLVVRWGGYVLMVFWLWYYFNDIRYAGFMVLINIFFWLSMRKDLARFYELKKKKGIEFTEEDVSEFIMMGKSLGRTLDRFSLYALCKKMKKRNSQPKDR